MAKRVSINGELFFNWGFGEIRFQASAASKSSRNVRRQISLWSSASHMEELGGDTVTGTRIRLHRARLERQLYRRVAAAAVKVKMQESSMELLNQDRLLFVLS